MEAELPQIEPIWKLELIEREAVADRRYKSGYRIRSTTLMIQSIPYEGVSTHYGPANVIMHNNTRLMGFEFKPMILRLESYRGDGN